MVKAAARKTSEVKYPLKVWQLLFADETPPEEVSGERLNVLSFPV